MSCVIFHSKIFVVRIFNLNFFTEISAKRTTMSLWNKVAAWLVSETGRKFSYIAAGTVSVGSMAAVSFPHIFFVEQYAKFWQLYKNGFSVTLNETLRQRFEKTLDLLEIPDQDKHLYRPFAAYGFDIISLGTSYSKYGVKIGLPVNFNYSSASSVDKDLIRLRDNSIVWDLDEGKMFQQSLVLPENAQLYAIAKEIKFRDTPKVFIDSVGAMLFCTSCYGLSRTINERLNLYVAPRHFRLIMYTLVGAFTFGIFIFMKDVTQIFFENQIDKELKKNPVFAEGGKQFYTNVINRNIALRKLLGSEGEKYYTSLGNDNYLFRHKHTPLVHRKLFFEEASVQ